MRVRRDNLRLGPLLAIALLSTGCGVYKQIANNVIIEPLQWDRHSDSIGRHMRDSSLASEAWEEICLRDGDVYSRHYRRGFFDGFKDYMDQGGTGDPPTTPPRSYWRLYFQNPEGHQAMQDWFDGFRHGASVARASGIRDYVVVPLSSVPPREILTDEPPGLETPAPGSAVTPEKMGPFPEKTPDKPGDKEGPVKPPITPPKTASTKPMPPPAPLIQVERMIAPPVPNKSNLPK